MNKKQNKIDSLPYQIDYNGKLFLKTRYTGIDSKSKQIVYEYRTEDDARRIWLFKDGSFYED